MMAQRHSSTQSQSGNYLTGWIQEPNALPPEQKNSAPTEQEASGPQGQSGRPGEEENLLSLPGYKSRTVKSVH